MKKEEIKYLAREKTKEGKSLEQAYAEIELLKRSQVNFRALNREIKHLQNEIKKRDLKIGKLQKAGLSFDSRAEAKAKQIKNGKIDESITIRDLNRIISVVEAEGKINLSDLKHVCVLDSKKGKSALGFLIKNKIIKEIPEKSKLYLVKN